MQTDTEPTIATKEDPPQREFGFDATLRITVRVEAGSEDEAVAAIKAALDCTYIGQFYVEGRLGCIDVTEGSVVTIDPAFEIGGEATGAEAPVDVVIQVEGGIVQDVETRSPLKVVVVDHDNIAGGDEHPLGSYEQQAVLTSGWHAAY